MTMTEPSTAEEQLEYWRTELSRALKANSALPWKNLIDWAEEAEEYASKTCTAGGRARVVKQEQRLASMEKLAAAWQQEAERNRTALEVPADVADVAEFRIWCALDRPLTEEEVHEHIRILRSVRRLAGDGLLIAASSYTEAKARLTALHTPVEHLGKTWCAACSVRRWTGPKTEEWVAFVPHPCPTLDAVSGTGWPPPDPGLPEGPFEESRGYQVCGDWGVDYAEDAEDARRQVAQALAEYPSCRARAEWRIVRTWDDDAEFTGPWQPLDEEESTR
ncbi:hypothetical protein AB0958_18890 [Streptomyces sp. NPDC006655]|uniref:hypothetical protein n=1 Tax=Streptomyces sp. NPDC006655 TaxID=3156898 RepID=UPI0034556F2C